LAGLDACAGTAQHKHACPLDSAAAMHAEPGAWGLETASALRQTGHDHDLRPLCAPAAVSFARADVTGGPAQGKTAPHVARGTRHLEADRVPVWLHALEACASLHGQRTQHTVNRPDASQPCPPSTPATYLPAPKGTPRARYRLIYHCTGPAALARVPGPLAMRTMLLLPEARRCNRMASTLGSVVQRMHMAAASAGASPSHRRSVLRHAHERLAATHPSHGGAVHRAASTWRRLAGAASTEALAC
jgi:hypothetical protein